MRFQWVSLELEKGEGEEGEGGTDVVVSLRGFIEPSMSQKSLDQVMGNM